MSQQPVQNCEFCFKELEETAAYHLVAWQAVAHQPDGPGFEFQLCRSCYYNVCRQVVEHREHMLTLQSELFQQKAAAYGIKV